MTAHLNQAHIIVKLSLLTICRMSLYRYNFPSYTWYLCTLHPVMVTKKHMDISCFPPQAAVSCGENVLVRDEYSATERSNRPHVAKSNHPGKLIDLGFLAI